MRVLELFAGYGSQALALENLGIDFTSDISEIDKYAIQAYNQLHGDTHNWGDITKIDETKLPYYDLITYSSPCQDFSTAGLGKGGDAGSGTRSSLLWECERIIRAVKPKYLLMENVKNLVGEKHKHNFIRWLRVLEMMGYQNFWKVLNAKDFGVPQNRERVFIIGFRKDYADLANNFHYPKPNKEKAKLKDIIEENEVSVKYYLSTKYVEGLERHKKNNEAKGNGFGYEILDLNGVSNALLVGGMGRERNLIIDKRLTDFTPKTNIQGEVNKQGIRRLTPRECWRLMGVKDEQFNKLHDISNTQLYKLAGNSIVVDVLMEIFKNLLLSDDGTKGQLTLF